MIARLSKERWRTALPRSVIWRSASRRWSCVGLETLASIRCCCGRRSSRARGLMGLQSVATRLPPTIFYSHLLVERCLVFGGAAAPIHPSPPASPFKGYPPPRQALGKSPASLSRELSNFGAAGAEVVLRIALDFRVPQIQGTPL